MRCIYYVTTRCTGHHELNKIGQGCDDENAFDERYDSRKWLVIHRPSSSRPLSTICHTLYAHLALVRATTTMTAGIITREHKFNLLFILGTSRHPLCTLLMPLVTRPAALKGLPVC